MNWNFSASSGWMTGLVGGALVAMLALVLAAYLGVVTINLENERHRANVTETDYRKRLDLLASRVQSLEATIEALRDRPLAVEPIVAAPLIVGDWTDGGANCMSIDKGARDREYFIKVWYCAAGEPDAAVTVSSRLPNSHFLGDKARRVAVRLLGDNLLVASFRYPPPNDRHMNMHVVFRKVTGRGVR